MAIDPVPYVIHGAKHSADVFRQSLYDSTGGAEGVSDPGALRVSATPTPSDKVRVAPGGALMLSPWDRGQTYNFRNATETLVPVPASSSLGAKTWYINAWVNDPNKPGGTTPVDPTYGPYSFLTCDETPNLNKPSYSPARIAVPASTATITNDMITDTRRMARPRRQEFQFYRPRVTGDNSAQNYLTGREPGGEYFPGGGGYANTFTVDVPVWATQMKIRSDWISVRYDGGRNVWGAYWMEYGTEFKPNTWPNKQQYEFATQKFSFDSAAAGNNSRTSWPLADTRDVPAKLRGKTVTFVFKAGLATASQTGVSMDAMGGLACDGTFLQSPVADWQGAS